MRIGIRLITLRFAMAVILIAGAVYPSEPATAQVEPSIEDVFKAIVRIDTTVPDGARTRDTLGATRTGHGAVIDANGLIVTIGYLVLEANSVTVTSHDGTTTPATVLAYDHDTGFGLVRTARPIPVKPLPIGKSDSVKQKAAAVIAGFGGSEAALPVRVVARREFTGYWEYLLERAIFTAPPYANFGGAALIDSTGALVGIGSLLVPNTTGDTEFTPGNMFVPIDRLKPLIKEANTLSQPTRSAKPWIGLYTEEVRGRLFVQRVAKDGPAQKAGLAHGDIVVKIGDTPVTTQAEFYRTLWSLGSPGTQVPVTVLTTTSEIKRVEIASKDRYHWYRFSKGN
jgi:S1-C subfamily serine protease